MNILLTGAAGQLGRELLPLLAGRGSVIPVDRSAPPRPLPGWVTLDLVHGGALETLLNRTRPALIVNTAAYTAVHAARPAGALGRTQWCGPGSLFDRVHLQRPGA